MVLYLIYINFFQGINKGSAVFLHILRELDDFASEVRRVAFYHSHTSESRKAEILKDLQLPLTSQQKKILCIVSTVSLGITKQFISRILYD